MVTWMFSCPRMFATSKIVIPEATMSDAAVCRLCRARHKRHTFASLMVQAGTTLEVLMKILGHLHFITVQRYAKFRPDVGVAPVRRLEDVRGEPEDELEGAGAGVVA